MSPKTRLWVRLIACFSVLVLIFGEAEARVKDLGVIGRVYQIAEKDMEELLKEKAAKLDIEALKKKILSDIKGATNPVFSIPRATERLVKHIDPSIAITDDIKDNQGRVLVPKGAVINPLDHVFLLKTYIIINGQDSSQVRFAAGLKDPKVILITEGEPIEVQKALNREIKMATVPVLQRFEIGHVPAIVSQEGKLIRVEEIPVN